MMVWWIFVCAKAVIGFLPMHKSHQSQANKCSFAKWKEGENSEQ